MNRLYIICIGVLLFASSSLQISIQEKNQMRSTDLTSQVGNEWIIGFKKGVDHEIKEMVYDYFNIMRTNNENELRSRFALVNDASIDEVDAFLDTFHEYVTYVEPNREAMSSSMKMDDHKDISTKETSDEDVPWHLDRIDQKSLPLDNIYHYTYTGKGVNIYSLGGYAATNLDEFSDAKVTNEHSTEGINDDDVSFGSGTSEASIAVGKTLGVAKDAHFRIVNTMRRDEKVYEANVARGLEYILNNGQKPAVVVGDFYFTTPVHLISNLLNELIDEGFIVVWTAGRLSRDSCRIYPSNRDSDHIAVGYTGIENDKDIRGQGYNHGNCIDIHGPSDNTQILNEDGTITDTGSGYTIFMVAGFASQMLERNNKLKQHDIKDEILRISQPLDSTLFPNTHDPRMIYTREFSSAQGMKVGFIMVISIIITFMFSM